MARRTPTPVDAHLRTARTAIDRGDIAEARRHLQQAMTLLAVNHDVVYVGVKVREIRRMEAHLRSPRRAKNRSVAAPASAPITPSKHSAPTTLIAQLDRRADTIETFLGQGRLAEARRSLDVLRQKADVLAGSSDGSRAIRARVLELQARLRKLEAQASPRNPKAKARSDSKKPAAARTSFICDRCRQPRPTSELVNKPGKRRVCVPCATGQVCPSCHRPKSPDFDLCIRCSGGGGKVKIVYGGAFESNRRKH